jgi:hypothetical protein
MLEDTGPYITMAGFCEKVLVEQGGALSIVRLTDTINRVDAGPEPADAMPPFVTDQLTIVVILRAGQAKGRFGIKLEPEAPSGLRLPPFEQGVQFVAGPWGTSIIAPIQMEVAEEGVYWFDVILTGPKQEDRRLTRVPLEIIYTPQKSA